jgi:hypothetical protein
LSISSKKKLRVSVAPLKQDSGNFVIFECALAVQDSPAPNAATSSGARSGTGQPFVDADTDPVFAPVGIGHYLRHRWVDGVRIVDQRERRGHIRNGGQVDRGSSLNRRKAVAEQTRILRQAYLPKGHLGPARLLTVISAKNDKATGRSKTDILSNRHQDSP